MKIEGHIIGSRKQSSWIDTQLKRLARNIMSHRSTRISTRRPGTST